MKLLVGNGAEVVDPEEGGIGGEELWDEGKEMLDAVGVTPSNESSTEKVVVYKGNRGDCPIEVDSKALISGAKDLECSELEDRDGKGYSDDDNIAELWEGVKSELADDDGKSDTVSSADLCTSFENETIFDSFAWEDGAKETLTNDSDDVTGGVRDDRKAAWDSDAKFEGETTREWVGKMVGGTVDVTALNIEAEAVLYGWDSKGAWKANEDEGDSEVGDNKGDGSKGSSIDMSAEGETEFSSKRSDVDAEIDGDPKEDSLV